MPRSVLKLSPKLLPTNFGGCNSACSPKRIWIYLLECSELSFTVLALSILLHSGYTDAPSTNQNYLQNWINDSIYNFSNLSCLQIPSIFATSVSQQLHHKPNAFHMDELTNTQTIPDKRWAPYPFPLSIYAEKIRINEDERNLLERHGAYKTLVKLESRSKISNKSAKPPGWHTQRSMSESASMMVMDLHARHSTEPRPTQTQPRHLRNMTNSKKPRSGPEPISLMKYSVFSRTNQRPVVVIDRPVLPNPTETSSSRSVTTMDPIKTDAAEETFPVLSFRYVERHTIELLVVVTEKMRQRFGNLLQDYLASTMTTVSSLLRHPSLKTSINLNIVDVILLDQSYASQHNLEDWSYSKQEQVMAKFCRWVNRLKRPNFTWDSALLLNVGHFKSTALGVAHYRSMCSEESACLAVLDRGFGTGYIIAHELGHQLGAKHDFERNSACGMHEQQTTIISDVSEHNDDMLGSMNGIPEEDNDDLSEQIWYSNRMEDIVRRDTLMSGTLYFDNFPLRWSACSRQAVHDFLESTIASCLRRDAIETPLHSSDWLAKRSQHDLPGAIFSLDQQCQFVLKVHNTRFCGEILPECRQLYCEDPETKGCLPMEAAWAEGSTCGEGKWCLQGECISQTRKPVRVEGNWGTWGPWSSCSQTCGGGVRFSERECNNPEPQNGGDFCHGTRTRMRSCAVQPCEKNKNIRQELCDVIAKRLGHPLEAYIPKLGELSACSLTCLDGDHAVTHRLRIPDGTPCYAQRDDICIKGECWETGCDRVLGSTKRFDQCRVCGGDNSTCTKIKGVYDGAAMNSIGVQQRGLITAVRIPRGVTNAFVRKKSPRKTPYSSDSYDDFMLLIFEELKTQIRRGETREPFAGAELYYSGSRRDEEIVSITGRLQKDVNIVIRVENPVTTRSLPLVEYHYFVDKSEQNSPLYFIAEEQARLSAKIGNIRTSRAQVQFNVPIQPSSSKKGEIRQHHLPMSDRRPRIHFVWRISELPSGCTTCAGNTTSYAECYPFIEDERLRKHFHPHDFYRPVADYLCASIPRPPPIIRQCADYCGVRWHLKPLSDERCSIRCGEGYIKAKHVCEEYVIPAEQRDKTKGHWREAQLGELACVRAGLGETPEKTESIACSGECHPVLWMLTNWTQCSGSCSYGHRRRDLKCHDSTGSAWPLSECYNELTHTGDETIEHETLITILDNYGKSLEHLQSMFTLEQSEACLNLATCINHIRWTVSDWSTCEPINDEMKSFCRSLESCGPNDKLSINFTAVRTRQVYCHLDVPNLDSSLKRFASRSELSGPPWLMDRNFCVLARSFGSVSDEPVESESCDRPFCYRWGRAKLSECSVPCGQGYRFASIPCEKIELHLKDQPQDGDQMECRIEQVHLQECHKHLSYSPRLILTEGNTSLHVETVERPYEGSDANEIPLINLEQEIQLECNNQPCTMKMPAWHTTSWEPCSANCGTGTKRRSAMCMLETYVQPTAIRPYQRVRNNVVTTGRLNIELTTEDKCLEAGLRKPALEQPCNEGACPQWLPAAWGDCEGICEYGIQHRDVRCVMDVSERKSQSTYQPDNPSEALIFPISPARNPIRKHRSIQLVEVDSERCESVASRPSTHRLCLLPSGCPYWTTGKWTSCSVGCGTGTKRRTVNCRFPNGTLKHTPQPAPHNPRSVKLTDFSLDNLVYLVRQGSLHSTCYHPRPLEEMNCKVRPCTGATPFWWPVMTTECGSTACEIGHRSHMIVCMSSSHGPIADSNCEHLAKPNDRTPCAPRQCRKFKWSTEPWSACPIGCGMKPRYRKVRCTGNFGGEYSDGLCLAHLKPESWDLCPNQCTDNPRSCSDIRQQNPNAQDGTYQITIGLSVISIYCVDMATNNPKEYITLRKVNFAKSSGYLRPTSGHNECLHMTKETEPNSIERITVPREIDTTNASNIPQSFHDEVTASNCPDCPYITHLAAVTYYDKIRLDINSLKIIVEDTRFTYTVGSSAIPYGSAKDCFGSTSCPQGRFQIDLRDTGFRIDVETSWAAGDDNTAVHIYRAEQGQVIRGQCGGQCSGCWPQPELLVRTMENGFH